MPQILSDRDAAELEQMLRWWRSNTDTRYQRRRPHGRGGGIRLHKAYCKVAAGSGNTIVCYKGSDSHDEDDEITVNIEIVGGSNLNAALPRLADGTLITVWNDGGTWRNAGNPFQASGDC